MKKATNCCWSTPDETYVGKIVCSHCERETVLVDVCINCGCGDCDEMDRCDYDPEYDDLNI